MSFSSHQGQFWVDRADMASEIVFTRKDRNRLADRWLLAMTMTAILLGIIRRITVDQAEPLWFDELFAASIATRPDFHTFITRCLHELSGPVYYGTLWLWTKVAGVSNGAIRLPSILPAIVAPFLILAWGHPDRRTRLVWAALTAIWLPFSYEATEAKPYSLLILFAVGQMIALTSHLRRPSTAMAVLWSSLSALMLLTHYHAIIITGFQGLLILCRGRRAIRWQAFLPFVPVVAWMSVHLHTVLAFANPSVSWYARPTLGQLTIFPEAVTGMTMVGGLQLLLMIVGMTIWSYRQQGLAMVRSAFAPWDVAAACTGAAAVLVIMVVSLIVPSFAPRYLLPFQPAIVFGIAIWAVAWSRRIPVFGALIILCFGLLACREYVNRLNDDPDMPRYPANYARASGFIDAAGPHRLLYLWDNPTATETGIPLYGEVAGFELARAGHGVPVKVLVLSRSRRDPNAALAAEVRPGDAILWAYDLTVHDTLATRYPPLLRRDPRWSCHDFGYMTIRVLACVQKQKVPLPAGWKPVSLSEL